LNHPVEFKSAVALAPIKLVINGAPRELSAALGARRLSDVLRD